MNYISLWCRIYASARCPDADCWGEHLVGQGSLGFVCVCLLLPRTATVCPSRSLAGKHIAITYCQKVDVHVRDHASLKWHIQLAASVGCFQAYACVCSPGVHATHACCHVCSSRCGCCVQAAVGVLLQHWRLLQAHWTVRGGATDVASWSGFVPMPAHVAVKSLALFVRMRCCCCLTAGKYSCSKLC